MHRFDSVLEKQMRQKFIETTSLLQIEEPLYRKNDKTLFIGMEIELPLISQNFLLSSQRKRDTIVSDFPHFASAELGAHQLEVIHEHPIDVKQLGIYLIENALEDNIKTIGQKNQDEGINIFRIGCCPFEKIDEVAHTSGYLYDKYRQVPMWHIIHQSFSTANILRIAEQIDVSNPYVVALMNSVQISVDAQSFDDAIDKLNRSLMISPMAVAIGANARYLNLMDTGYMDVRFPAWEISHDTRSRQEKVNGQLTRVGLPQGYYQSIDDYFGSLLKYPFILASPNYQKNSFEIGNGLYWRDARLKFFREKKTIAVEFRPVALQPTLHEDVAMVVFYLGRLLWSQHNKETLLPFECVRQNKDQAMRYGMGCKLFTQDNTQVRLCSAKNALQYEINKAEEGLSLLGVNAEEIAYFLDTLRKRLITGSPAECFTKKVKECERTANRKEALITAIQEFNLVQPLR